jgi:hypothetical protein
MWRPNEFVDDDVSNIDQQRKRRRSRRRAWRDGLADQTVVQNLEDVRSYRAFERALIGSVEPRSMIELALVHRLASLLWRLRRATAIETGLFEIQGEHLLARQEDSRREPGTLEIAIRANGHSKGPGSNGRDNPSALNQKPPSASMRASRGPWSKSRTLAQCLLRPPILTGAGLTARAATKRDCGAKPRKQYGLLAL